MARRAKHPTLPGIRSTDTTFIIEIGIGNDAMQTGDDVAIAVMRALGELRGNAELLETRVIDRSNEIYDRNGNKVGRYFVAASRWSPWCK